MEETTIECPSCSRRIRIPLRRRLSCFEITQNFDDLPLCPVMVCMQETNKKHGVQCEFFRLDFRQPYFDETLEFPGGALILDMKWGSKKELINGG